jgi:hypothetical protein
MTAGAPKAALSFTKIITNKTGEFIDLKFKEKNFFICSFHLC